MMRWLDRFCDWLGRVVFEEPTDFNPYTYHDEYYDGQER